ncbi:MAG: hypothetical protein ACI8RZ_006268 [Myxococcota bacterium]|jgi:hypothetical protein
MLHRVRRLKMMWLMLWACSGGDDGSDSGEADSEAGCESVAVASYEVVLSLLASDGKMPAALLKHEGSTLCEGDQVVWWANYYTPSDWYIQDNFDEHEVYGGTFLMDVGVPFDDEVLLALVPKGEDPETWNPCEYPYDIFSQSCGYVGFALLEVTVLAE